MKTGPDIARMASAIGDPARANMLTALMSGKALTSSELALEAGVAAATASSHLARLQEAGLVTVEQQGRHRYWRMTGPEVAEVLEKLMGLAARSGETRLRTGPREPALRKARVCYDHLAGDYGVRLYDSLVARDIINVDNGGLSLGTAAGPFISDMQLSVRPGRMPCRACLDWSVRRHHLAGGLGAALLDRMFALGWAKREAGTRAVLFTAEGERKFLDMTRTD
jgi:DNA-binding transcriptional ArsR family regulator